MKSKELQQKKLIMKVNKMAMNATGTGFNAIAAVNSTGMAWIVGVFLFVITFCILFAIIKNFRRLIYGLATAIPIGLIGWFSYGIASPIKEGNWLPVLSTIKVIFGILVAIGLGMIVEKFEIVKKFELATGIEVENDKNTKKYNK